MKCDIITVLIMYKEMGESKYYFELSISSRLNSDDQPERIWNRAIFLSMDTGTNHHHVYQCTVMS